MESFTFFFSNVFAYVFIMQTMGWNWVAKNETSFTFLMENAILIIFALKSPPFLPAASYSGF